MEWLFTPLSVIFVGRIPVTSGRGTVRSAAISVFMNMDCMGATPRRGNVGHHFHFPVFLGEGYRSTDSVLTERTDRSHRRFGFRLGIHQVFGCGRIPRLTSRAGRRTV